MNAYTGSITDNVGLSNRSTCQPGTPAATLPGRILYIHNPVNNAAGIVTMIVNIPQELSLSALTTTIPTLAKVTTMINSVATELVSPDSRPMLERAIFGSDNPS